MGALWGKEDPQNLGEGGGGPFLGGRDTPVDAGKEVTELGGQEGAAPPGCLQGKGGSVPTGGPSPPPPNQRPP